MSKKRIQYKDYADYLKSEKWKQVKKDYDDSDRDRAHCYFCYSSDITIQSNFNYHHWTYPKDWNDDTHENLIKVCDSCHKVLHESKLEHNSHTYNNDFDYISDASKVISSWGFNKGRDSLDENNYIDYSNIQIAEISKLNSQIERRDKFIQMILSENQELRNG
jgi:hypothetical protein